MKPYNALRHSYVEMVRANRSEIVLERERIEHQKSALLKVRLYPQIITKCPLMKTYLWFNFLVKASPFEIREEQRLSSLRNKRELELHQMKTVLDTVDH